MPGTYQWADAITHITDHIRGVPIDDISAITCDMINSVMWRAYPWPWALSPLTAITLVDGVQDYSIDSADLTSFMRLVKIRIVRTDVTPNDYNRLEVWKWLEPNVIGKIGFGQMRLVCHDRRTNKLRLESAVGVTSGLVMQFDGEFQTRPTKITSTSSVISFPDQYFDVAVSGLLWQAYKYAGDKRSGTAVINDGILQYTGQLGEFHDALISMAQAESWGQGDQYSPEFPLIEFDL